jgi:hypothetical protein
MATMSKADAGTTYVVCEGQADAVLVDRLLIPPFDRERVRVLAANGIGMAVSLARTLLTTTPARVAVAVDADGGSAVRSDVEMALADVAYRPRWGVFVFTPSLERLVATEPAAVAAVVGRSLAEAELADLAQDPARFLKAAAALRQESYPSFIDQLARQLKPGGARDKEPMPSLIAFVNAAPAALLAQPA